MTMRIFKALKMLNYPDQLRGHLFENIYIVLFLASCNLLSALKLVIFVDLQIFIIFHIYKSNSFSHLSYISTCFAGNKALS